MPLDVSTTSVSPVLAVTLQGSKVRLAAAAEFYADYFCHGIFLIS